MVDVDSAKWSQYARETPWPLSWLYAREGRTLLAYEKSIAQRFDATVFVSSAEVELFASLAGRCGKPVLHAGNGVDTDYFDPATRFESPYPPGARHLVFTGAMDYRPNVDAVDWFARTVLPRVRARWSDMRFAIVGSNPVPAVERLAKLPGVLVTGTVPDVRPYVAHAAAVVAPLRIARGVQNKVLEGMAMGRVVIASSQAAKGVEARAQSEFLLADTPDQYLDSIAAAMDPRCQIGRHARGRVLESYSWESNLRPILQMLSASKESCVATRERIAPAA
jgi:sugar transferase (PEP-CTERM/EpsH1 system associated)